MVSADEVWWEALYPDSRPFYIHEVSWQNRVMLGDTLTVDRATGAVEHAGPVRGRYCRWDPATGATIDFDTLAHFTFEPCSRVGGLSAEPGNALTVGFDGGLYVPEPVTGGGYAGRWGDRLRRRWPRWVGWRKASDD